MKVLLVEDSLVLAERMTEIIRDIDGVQLTDIVDCEEKALVALRRRSVDVVILDLQLKQGSGLGILSAIRDMHRKPRVVVLTNHDLAQYRREAIALGANYFLDKARNFESLPGVLSEIKESMIQDADEHRDQKRRDI